MSEKVVRKRGLATSAAAAAAVSTSSALSSSSSSSSPSSSEAPAKKKKRNSAAESNDWSSHTLSAVDLQQSSSSSSSSSICRSEERMILKPEAALEKTDVTISIAAYDCIVLDIEGTTTPITFVTKVLFPFVTTHVESYLQRTWDTELTRTDVKNLVDLSVQDVKDKVVGAMEIPTVSSKVTVAMAQAAVVNNVHWQMSMDLKRTALKTLQGHMWVEGYASGELKGALYADVLPALKRWKKAGKKICIYSSGSVGAQKLLFGHSSAGDLNHFFCNYFDTAVGGKREVTSYTNIAKQLQVDPRKILFISDILEELEACKGADMGVLLCVRPGNLPVPANHGHPLCHSFKCVK